MSTIRLVGIGSTHRFTDNRDEVSYGGDTWTQRGLIVKSIEIGQLQITRAVATIWDEDNTLSTESRTTCLTGQDGYIYHVKDDGSGGWIADDEYPQIHLEVTDVSGEWPWITIELGAMSGWKRSRGLPVGSKICRKILGGPYCQYAGVDVTCARDREHCRTVKNNLANHGGLYFAPEANEIINLGPVTTKIPASPTGGRLQRPDLGGDSGTEDETGRRTRRRGETPITTIVTRYYYTGGI